MNQKSTLLLIDGHNLLFQMFFGMPAPIRDKDGTDVRGTLGFIGALIKLIKMTNPTHLAVFFDSETHNERRDILPEYKANRPDWSAMDIDETPFSQLPDIYRALDFMNIRHTEVKDAETDDCIAAYCVGNSEFDKIYIASYDSDYFQLINEKVSVIRYRGKCSSVCDERFINEKFGIEPYEYCDWKAMVGDGADNIKGISGIGPKTATALIHECGSLNAMITNSTVIQNARIRKKIEDGADTLLRNMRLIKLRGNVPLAFTNDELHLNSNVSDLKTMDVLHGIGRLIQS